MDGKMMKEALSAGVNVVNAFSKSVAAVAKTVYDNALEKAGLKKDKAVQIFAPDESSGELRYRLDKDALEEILGQEEIANCPIAIYSIAGAYRTGKSFLLNLFLMFLKADRSKNWIKNKLAELSRDFVWRGGTDRCTAGIWMWNEPFELKTKDGEKIMLFLIDTQGTFDNKSNMEQNSMIFALSTLISSVQIFNLFRNIYETDLQYLNLFTDYARAAKHDSNNANDQPFQKLIFLIRDYSLSKQRGFKGGKRVLKKFLSNDNNLEELQNTRKICLKSFETTECFCASFPGDNVAESDNRDASDGSSESDECAASDESSESDECAASGKNPVRDESSEQHLPLKLSDIKPKFLKEITQLARHLFVDNIVPKKVNGEVVTASQLINVIIAYGDVFESGKMPEVNSIVTATAKACLITIVQKLEASAYNEILQTTSSGYKNSNVLKDIFRSIKQKALKEFDRTPKMGGDELVKNYREHLSRLIDQKFAAIKQDNSRHLALLRSSIDKEKENTVQKYTKYFQNNIPEDLMSPDIRENEQKFFKDALRCFKENTNPFDSEVVHPFVKKLEDQLKKNFARCVELRKQELKEAETKLSTAVEQSKLLYSQNMEKDCQGKCLETNKFANTHQKHKNEALRKFEVFDVKCSASMKEQKRENLVDKIETLMEIYRQTNQDNLKNMKANDKRAAGAINKVKIDYVAAMSRICVQKWLPQDAFEATHESSIRQAESEIDNLLDQRQAEECKQELRGIFALELLKFQFLNEASRTRAIHEMSSKANEALHFYKKKVTSKRMKAKHQFLDDDDLKKCHIAIREKAFQMYGKISQEPKEEFEKIKQKLSENIQTELQNFESENTQNKENAENEANKLIEEMKSKYMKKMMEICSDGYADPEHFSNAHKTAKEKIVKDFIERYKKFPNKQEQLENGLETTFRQIQQNNEENKPFFLRRLGSWIFTKFVKFITDFLASLPDMIFETVVKGVEKAKVNMKISN